MFTRVLVAVEHAAQAARVLAVAEILANQGPPHASIRVTLAHTTTCLLGSAEVQASSAELAQLAEWLRNDGIEADYLLKVERPARGIVDAASQARADLIVLMPHGRHRLDTLMHPSVMAKLLASGTAPLLIWPQLLPDTCARDLLYMPDSRVVLPLDGSQQAERALPYAIELANAYERSLLLVRVISDLPPPLVTMGAMGALGPSAYAPSDLPRVEQEEAQAYLRRIVDRYANDTIAPIETITLLGTPVRRILDLASAHPYSVIVMSTHGRGALARATMGSVTTATAQDATTPVLVIPPHALAPFSRTAPLTRQIAAS
jgi:nucleotide-binding universal stress UspA family protein